jgi:hypothetical protein
MSELNPRKLTLHQQAVLIQVLLTFPDQHVDVFYDPGSHDALGYARQFLTIFKVIGWRVNDGAPSKILADKFNGLTFVISEPGSLPPSAEALRDALRIYEIEATTFCDPSCNMRSGGFVLAVGPHA